MSNKLKRKKSKEVRPEEYVVENLGELYEALIQFGNLSEDLLRRIAIDIVQYQDALKDETLRGYIDYVMSYYPILATDVIMQAAFWELMSMYYIICKSENIVTEKSISKFADRFLSNPEGTLKRINLL